MWRKLKQITRLDVRVDQNTLFHLQVVFPPLPSLNKHQPTVVTEMSTNSVYTSPRTTAEQIAKRRTKLFKVQGSRFNIASKVRLLSVDLASIKTSLSSDGNNPVFRLKQFAYSYLPNIIRQQSVFTICEQDTSYPCYSLISSDS